MKFYKAFSVLTLLACLSLSSCQHVLPNGGGGGGGNNNGNAFLNVTVTSTPSSTFFFPSLNWQIGNVLLINAAGTSTPIAGGGGSPILDFARLQTDSLYMGHVFVGATTYNKLTVEFNTPQRFSYVYNSTNATLFSGASACAPGLVCQIPDTVAGFSSATVTVPVTFAATANNNAGIRINFDLSKAVTTAGGMTFDFTQPGAITVITLPPSSSQTSGLDTIDNATGVITAVSGTSLSIRNFSDGQTDFTVAANAAFTDPLGLLQCTPLVSTCLAVGQNISIDGVIGSDGTRTATQIEFLDPAPAVNELEGIIISPVANNQFKMVLTNGMGSNILIASSTVIVNLNNAPAFLIDPKNLSGILPSGNLGFQSQADLVVGQTVMVQGGTFSGNNTSITNPTRVLLRYSSIGGTVQTVGNPAFTLGSISPFFTNLPANTVQVETFIPGTAYDNITGFSGLVANTTNVSVRGLYLNPNSGATQPLLAAKIRSH